MDSSRVQVTYAGPATLLGTDQWTYLRTAFSRQLPLHNLHWKSASRPSIRTIQELQIDLVPLEAVKDEHVSQVPSSLLEKPLLNLYFVQCEDNDVYKNSVKKQIRDWVSSVQARRNQEFLVILVVRPETRPAGTGRLFQMKSTMLDKMKSDFNSKRDRCVQLNWSLAVDEPAGWTDLILRMKENIVYSFDALVGGREEDVKRSESQRQMPGWNFCTFFVLKESLALSFEGMNLLEDALVQYDELEASFFQVLKEMNLSWFGKLGGNDPGDDAAPLLSVTKKPYRDLMLANTITVFDFRCYLLARQCSLLGQMGRVSRLARKAAHFISSFALTLEEESHDTFPDYFLESWMYSSAISVVQHCQAWSREVTLDAAATIALNAIIGELLELARQQLDKLGIHTGHLPAVDPFVMASRDHKDNRSVASFETASEARAPPGGITNKDLLSAIQDRDSFDRLYMATTKRAIEAYVISKRKRFALRLHYSLAVLELLRDHRAAAESAFRSLPPHYTHAQWASLEAPLFGRSAACHDGEPKSAEWVADVLSLLKSYVTVQQMDSEECLQAEYQDLGGAGPYFARLLSDLRTAAAVLSDELRVKDHPALSVSLAERNARPAEHQDGSLLEVSIQNQFPCEVQLDSVEITFVGRDGDRVIFNHEMTVVTPGWSSITLFCSTPAFGLFSLESSSMSLSRISFYQAFHPNEAGFSQTVRLSEDCSCTEMLAYPPRALHLDQSPRILLTLATGRNQIKESSFTIRDLNGNITFKTPGSVRERYSEAEPVGSLSFGESEISFADLPSNTRVEVSVPYYGGDRGSGISLLIEGTYITVGQPMVKRAFRRIRHVQVTLPMAVNVQDFFRGKGVFSKFTVSSDGQQYLRLLGAELAGETAVYTIEKSRSASSKPTVVSPNRQASLLFNLRMTAAAYHEIREALRVVITYTSLWDELETLAAKHVRKIAASLRLQAHEAWILRTFLDRLHEDTAQLEWYSHTGTVQCSSGPWRDPVRLYQQGSDLQDQLIQALDMLAESMRSPQSNPNPKLCGVRTLSIPVDVPIIKILNCVRIDISDHSALFAGQPVAAVLSITTRINRIGHAEVLEQVNMGFDVNADFSTWLVSGQKRGEFVIQNNGTFSVPLTLIPIRHGSLFLPQVAVYPLVDEEQPSDGQMPELPTSETYQSNAAERVLVLSRSTRSTYMINLPTGVTSYFTDIGD